MKRKVGVLLSGCGVYDGSEIHEAVLTLLALDQGGAEAVCMAPNIAQMHVINHLNGQVADEKRNVLVESARIARGRISDVAAVKAADLDAVILPGGFGAAKNLSDFAVKGDNCQAHPEVKRLLGQMRAAQKPIGAICIAPAVLARVLGEHRPALTIGNDAGTAAALEAMGAMHVACGVDGIHVDKANRLVTTPAYMLGPGIKDVAVGIGKLVDQVLAMIA